MAPGIVRALSLFSVVPVRVAPELAPDEARRALAWLPLVGAALGAVAALPLVAVRAWAPHAALVGALLAVAVLAVLTRALHLDGLADTADGLGSRAPAERARTIMRQSDIGPFGVISLVLVLGLDVAGLASVPHGTWAPCAALALAATTGRIAALWAATAPPAHPDGFGALVAGSAQRVAAAGWTVLALVGAVLLALAVGASPAWWAGAVAVALLVAAALRWHAVRRLGGMTGDVYGALVELGTVVVLAGLALS